MNVQRTRYETSRMEFGSKAKTGPSKSVARVVTREGFQAGLLTAIFLSTFFAVSVSADAMPEAFAGTLKTTDGMASIDSGDLVRVVCADYRFTVRASWIAQDQSVLASGIVRSASFRMTAIDAYGNALGNASHTETWISTPFVANSMEATSLAITITPPTAAGPEYVIVRLQSTLFEGTVSVSDAQVTMSFVSTCSLLMPCTITLDLTAPKSIMYPSKFSDRVTVTNNCLVPAEVTITAHVPTGPNADCTLGTMDASVNSGILGPATWLMLSQRPPIPIDGVSGPLLELTWVMTPEAPGPCDVVATATEKFDSALHQVERITHILPQIGTTTVDLGGLDARDDGFSHWDQIDEDVPPPALTDVDVHMAGAFAVVPVAGNVETMGMKSDEYGHFSISPTATAETMKLLFPDCANLRLCDSLDAFADVRVNTPHPIPMATITQVTAGSTTTVCLKGQYMDAGDSDDDGANCVVLHGIHDNTLENMAKSRSLPVELVSYVLPHL